MPVPYQKQTWVDGAGGGTPISATRLGVMEQGIQDAQYPSPGYIVLEDDFWNTESSDGQIGALGWSIVNGSQGTTSHEPGITDHIGIRRMSANNVAGNITGLASDPGGGGEGIILPAQVDRIIWIISPNSANSGTNFRCGLATDPSIASCGTDGVWWDYANASNANWRSVSRGSSVNTTNNSTVTVVADNWYKLEIRRASNGNWEFWANDVLRFTHSTNLPNAANPLQPFAVVETSAASSKQINIDYFALMSVTLGNRYT